MPPWPKLRVLLTTAHTRKYDLARSMASSYWLSSTSDDKIPDVFSDWRRRSGNDVELLKATAGIVYGDSLNMYAAALPMLSEMMVYDRAQTRIVT